MQLFSQHLHSDTSFLLRTLQTRLIETMQGMLCSRCDQVILCVCPGISQRHNNFSLVLFLSKHARTLDIINAFHAAGECRRQGTGTKCSKNFKIPEFGDYIWNHHTKYIQISTNMPAIGSVIHKIDGKNQNKLTKVKRLLRVKSMPAV